MNYNFNRYDKDRNAVEMTGSDGSELVIDCEKHIHLNIKGVLGGFPLTRS